MGQEIRQGLEKHENAIEEIATSLIDGKTDEVIPALAGLGVSVFTGLPIVGSLTNAALKEIFAVPANRVLDRQVEEWRQEQKTTAHLAELKDWIEALMGQMVLQLVRSQHAVSNDLAKRLGDKRDDLAEFRSDVTEAIKSTGALIQVDEIFNEDQGTVFEISGSALSRIFVKKIVNKGRGSTIFKL